MATGRSKYIRMSEKFTGVALYISESNIERWRSVVNGNGKYFDTELEAAKHTDKMLIAIGKEPGMYLCVGNFKNLQRTVEAVK